MKTQYFGAKANNSTGSSCFELFGTFCPYLRTNERPGTDHVTSGPMRGLHENLNSETIYITDMMVILYTFCNKQNQLERNVGLQHFQILLKQPKE